MRKCKGILALLLSVMITVTFTPSIAFAGSGDSGDPGSDVVGEQRAETGVAQIDDATFVSLQSAIDAAHEMTGDVTITLLDNITEVAVIHQKADLNLTVDGDGNTITGQIYIDGDGRFAGGDALTIKNTKFVYDAATYDDAFIDTPNTKTAGKIYTTDKYNYAHNITVDGCEFTGEGTTTVAFRVASGAGAQNITLKNNTATGGHSFAQLTGVTDLTIAGNTVTGVKNGINISGGTGIAAVTGNTVSADGYTIRVKDANSSAVTLEDNTFSGSEGIVNTATGNAAITINSGTYTGPLETGNNGNITITGGSFSEKVPKACIAEGYECVKDGDVYVVQAKAPVAAIGEAEFFSLQEAVAAAENGDVIKVIADVTIDAAESPITVPAGKSITLDLNGCKVSMNKEEAAASTLLTNNGTLTIEDSVGTGEMYASADEPWIYSEANPGGYANDLISNRGTLTVNGGKLYNAGEGSACYAIDNFSAGTVTINGGIIDAAKSSAIRMFYNTNGSITVNDGTIGHYNDDDDCSYMGIQVQSGAVTATLNGGTIDGDYSFYTNGGGTYAITGGTYPGYVGFGSNITSDQASITGGVFESWVGTWGDAKFISGGTFATDVNDCCIDGFICVPDAEHEGQYIVRAAEYVAQVGDQKFESFTEAVEARTSDNDVITLLANVSEPYTMALGDVLKVKKDGNTITIKGPEGPYVLSSSLSNGVTTYSVSEADIEYTNASGVVSYKLYSNTVVSATGTYKLLKDITASARIVPGISANSVTIDLNGHTITSTASDCAVLLNRAGTASGHKVFSIVDTSENKGGKIIVNPAANQAIQVNGNYNDVVIGEGVTIDGGCVALLKENDTLTVNGSINGGNDFAIATNGSTTKNATININDGAVITSNITAIYLPGTGKTTVSGGTITGATAIFQKSGELEITGGKIVGNGEAVPFVHNPNGCNATGDAVVVESCDYPGGAPVTSITGGTFESVNAHPVASYSQDADTYPVITGFVSGGRFNNNNVDLSVLAEGKVLSKAADGYYEVGDVVAVIGDTGFASLKDAVEAAQAGDTVELIKDTKIESIAIDKKVTLDLNGKKVSSDGIELFAVSENGDLTIKGDGTVEGPANGEAFDGNSLIIVDKGKLTIEDGTFTATGAGSDGMYGIYVLNGGTAVFGTEEGGPTITSHFAAIGTNNTTAPVTITVNNGVYTANANPENNAWWHYFCAPIYAASNGDYTINGGTFKGYYGVSSRYVNVEQTLSIEGGEFVTTKTDVFADVVEGSVGAANRVITTKDNSLSVPEGYAWVEEGDHYVLKTPLELAKAEALAELDAVDIDSYIEEHQYKVYRLIENARGNVEAASMVVQVEAIMNSFETTLENYKKLADAKAEAIAALEAYKSDVEFADENARGEIVAEGSANITAAATSSAVYKALADAKEAIDALQTKAEKEKADAKAALEAALADAEATDTDVYTDETVAVLADAIAEATAVLGDNEATTRQYNNATAALENAVAGLITKEQAEADAAAAAAAALAEAKADAKAELEGYKDAADYRDAEKEQLAAMVAAGKDAIDEAATPAAVAEALEAAKTQIDGLKTAAQYEAEEAAAADQTLAEAKAAAKEELKDYKDPADYRDAEKVELRAIKADAREAIDAAATVAEVEAALEAAKAELDAVKTAAQYEAEEAAAAEAALADAKAAAIEALNGIDSSAYRDEVRDGQTETDKTQVEAIVDAAKADVGAATSIEQVAQILDGVADSLEAIPTDKDLTEAEAAALKDAQNAAVAAINDKLADAQDKIDDADKSTVATAAMNAKIDVVTATTPEQAAAAAQNFIDLVDEMIEAKEDAERALAEAKEAANAALDAYVSDENLAKYRDEDQQTIRDIVAEAKAAVDAATTPEAVNQILADAQTAVSAVKTDAQRTEEEEAAEGDLSDAKAAALAELDKINLANYIEPERSIVKKTVEDAKKAIDSAASVAAVNDVVAAANKTIKAQGVYNASLPKVTNKKPTKGKKKMTAKWKKLSKKKAKKVTGIEIQYAQNKAFTQNAKMIKIKKTKKSKKIKKLVAKKTYWVRVRTYKTTSTGKLVSGWSKVKKVKIK